MKTCPKCGTAYTDNTLSFCLSDGTPLVGERAEYETEVLPNIASDLETQDSVSAQTQIKATQTDEGLTQSVVSGPKKGTSSLWILATFALLGIIIFGSAFAWFFLIRNNPQGDANTENGLASNSSAEIPTIPKRTQKSAPKRNTYRVVGVKNNDVLYIRPRPGNLKTVVGRIPANGTGIKITGKGKRVGKSIWVPIIYQGKRGWVNRRFLGKPK